MGEHERVGVGGLGVRGAEDACAAFIRVERRPAEETEGQAHGGDGGGGEEAVALSG